MENEGEGQGQRAQECLERMLELMDADVEVEGRESDDQVKLAITGPESSALIGKKGRTLDAMQFLVNKMVARHVVDDDRKLVVIDSDGYRERREDSLAQLAQRLGRKVLDEGKAIRLNPMSARDRRVIHMTLRETSGVATRSEGEGEDRRLLIVPDAHAS